MFQASEWPNSVIPRPDKPRSMPSKITFPLPMWEQSQGEGDPMIRERGEYLVSRFRYPILA